MSDWTKIKAICTPEQVEHVSAIMTMLDSHLMIEDNSDIEEYNSMYGELIDDSLKNKTDAAGFGIYTEGGKRSEAAAFARQRFKDLGMNVSVSLEGLNEEDWATTGKNIIIRFPSADISQLFRSGVWILMSADRTM